MPIIVDMNLVRLEDGLFKVEMTPFVSISGWSVQFQTMKRAGGISGLITLSMASGFAAGQSGLTLTDGVAGKFQAQINSAYTSGWDYGNYFTKIERLDSGSRTAIDEGYLVIMP